MRLEGPEQLSRQSNVIPTHKSGKARIATETATAPRPPALGGNRRARRGHDDASGAVVTEATDPGVSRASRSDVRN
jgi:hypothetical protein